MHAMMPYIRLCLFIACLIPWPAAGDEIVLNTGERFSSDRIWEENGKVRFNMHGLVVSVDKADVAAIIKSDGTMQPALPSQSTRSVQTAVADPAETSTPPETAPPPAQKTATDHQQHEPVPGKAPGTTPPRESVSKTRGIGFEGIEWQMRPSQIPGIEKFKTDPAYGGIDQYWRPEGRLKLGDVLLDGLVFGFWQDRLYTVMLWVDGRPGYERLRRVVADRYGEGKKSPSGLERHVWLDETTDRMLEFDAASNTGIFWMRSRNLDTYVKQRYPD